MKCNKCPMYHYWNNESDRDEACGIFGDGWDSPFQYEDKEGTQGSTAQQGGVGVCGSGSPTG